MRRSGTVPLVYQSRDWQHGTFLGDDRFYLLDQLECVLRGEAEPPRMSTAITHVAGR